MNKRVATGIGLIATALGLYFWTRKAGVACTEGATKCDAGNLYACVSGKWVLQELNSPVCVVPPSCSVDSDCPPGYVCQNGVCIPQSVRQWEFYGVVTDAQTKAPIPSVAVGMNGISSTGDSEGKYTISGVVDTEHIVIIFSAEGYASRDYTVGWGAMPYELNASLVLKEIAQATLYGTVTDDKGNPVEGATLSLYWDGNTHPEYSRTVGSSYSVEAVSPGVWHITVEKQGYDTWDNMVTVIGGETNELNIVLTQIWDWAGINQPEDYMSRWVKMAAQGMEAVLADILEIPGMPYLYEKVNIYDPLAFGITTILENHLPEYIYGWTECKIYDSGGTFIAYTPPRGYKVTSEYINPTPPNWPVSLSVRVRCEQLPVGFEPFYSTRPPGEKWHACVDSDECTSVPSLEGLGTELISGVLGDRLKYVAIYAECKRHGSGASTFYQFWDYLSVRAYGPGCPGSHCQVTGYIFYDSYGSGIGWDVDYRADRWKYLYRAGELLHYV